MQELRKLSYLNSIKVKVGPSGVRMLIYLYICNCFNSIKISENARTKKIKIFKFN